MPKRPRVALFDPDPRYAEILSKALPGIELEHHLSSTAGLEKVAAAPPTWCCSIEDRRLYHLASNGRWVVELVRRFRDEHHYKL